MTGWSHRRRVAGCLLGLLGTLAITRCLAAPFEGEIRLSRSGQFVAHGSPNGVGPGNSRTNLNLVRLRPDFLVVSCEHIKEALWFELGVRDLGRDQVHLFLWPNLPPDQPVGIASIHSPDQGRWFYKVNLPEQMPAASLTRAVVQVLLLEMANRQAESRPAEIPVWLTMGLSGRLLSAHGSDLVYNAPDAVKVAGSTWWVGVSDRDQLRWDLRQAAQERARTNAPLSFADLNLPSANLLTGDNLKLYQSCAELFLDDLIHLPDGRARLLEMVRTLPQYYNWQTAFLRAFGDQFHSLLDVEKWWAVNLTSAVARGDTGAWSREAGLSRFDELLLVAGESRVSTNEIPRPARLKLQTVIQDWEYSRQRPVLQEKLVLLAFSRTAAPEAFVNLLDGYLATLSSYLQQRDHSGLNSGLKGQPAFSAPLLVKETTRRLNELDRDRAAARSTNAPPKTLTTTRR